MLKHFSAILLLLGISTLFAAEPTRVEAVAELAKPFLEKYPKASLAIGVVKSGEKESFFFGDVELDGKSVKPDAETLYEIGSITKVFTGTLLGQMALEKKLKLDDPIQPHLPKDWKLPRRDDRDITFLHCTTHTSSLPVQPPSLPFVAIGKKSPEDPYSVYDSEYLAGILTEIKNKVALRKGVRRNWLVDFKKTDRRRGAGKSTQFAARPVDNHRRRPF